MRFSINCLEITATKDIVENYGNIYKNLLTAKEFEGKNFKFPKRFFFNDFYQREPDENGNLVPTEADKRLNSDLFFGKNINIQAIVGMNGCGKSSLLDLMYMAINNFAYMYERGKERPRAQRLFFVKNLFVNLYFSIEDREYRLFCTNNQVQLQIKTDNHFSPVGDSWRNIKAAFNINNYNKNDYPNDTEEKLYYLMQDFFYTIATNYSIQSFLPSDYTQDLYEFISGESRDVIKSEDNRWITSVFQKNDGYVCPVVLNPKREDYGINMSLEKKLAKYREIALLIWARNNGTRFLDEYELYDIKFEPDKDYILRKTKAKSLKTVLNDIEKKIYIPQYGISQTNELNSLTVRNNFLISTESPILVKIVLSVLIEKIYSITNSAPYTIYGVEGKKSVFKSNGSFAISYFNELLSITEKDKSHVVTKIKQMLNFLRQDWMNNFVLMNVVNNWCEKGFTLSEYEKYFRKDYKNLDDIMCHLPPAIFKYDIWLKKISTGEIVNMSSLSSGESQMIQTLSTHMYHIRNILSIKEANKVFFRNNEFNKLRPDYACINLIFDEVEICFHPEYQRLFIDKLIKMLKNMKMTDECSFNIFIVTHSPFILSDLPSSNIMYMKNGSTASITTEAFGQNISDLLNQYFFLNSFVGEFSKTKINSLIDYLLGNKTEDKWTKDSAIHFIESIGDEFLRRNLKKKFNEVFMKG